MPRRPRTIEILEAPDGADYDTSVPRLGQAISILAGIAARIQKREQILAVLPILKFGEIETILHDDFRGSVWDWLRG